MAHLGPDVFKGVNAHPPPPPVPRGRPDGHVHLPRNPVRLEQRMGRVHRSGRSRKCMIFNFCRNQHDRGRAASRDWDGRAIKHHRDELGPAARLAK